MANDKEVVVDFIELLSEELVTRLGDTADIADVIYHLCERGYIEPSTLRDKVISCEYPILSSKMTYKETAAEDLAEKYSLSSRQIKNIVKKAIKRFSANGNIQVK